MHEMSRAKKLMGKLMDMWAESPAPTAHVKVYVSPLAGVDSDELMECLQLLTRGSCVEGWQVEIAVGSFALRCLKCGSTFSSEKPNVSCPECGSEKLSIEPQDEIWVERVSTPEMSREIVTANSSIPPSFAGGEL